MDQSPSTPNLEPLPVTPEAVETPAVSTSPEARPLTTPERGKEELSHPAQSESAQPLVLPPVQVVTEDTAKSVVVDDPSIDTPLIADDVDIIEMEWVDRAKKIIKDTKDDPYAQEEAMEQLQIDYLKKRYGKDIKKSRSD